jgi:hypothetical protein
VAEHRPDGWIAFNAWEGVQLRQAGYRGRVVCLIVDHAKPFARPFAGLVKDDAVLVDGLRELDQQVRAHHGGTSVHRRIILMPTWVEAADDGV